MTFVKTALFHKAGEGSGGGGGGAVDKSKIVNADTIPTASASNSGYVYLYTGTTNASYTHGYVYQNVKSATYTGTVTFEAATLSETTVTCSGDDFAVFLTEAGANPTPIVSGTMTYEADATGWRLVGKDSNGDTVTTFLEYVEDYQDAGFTFTGTPQDGDVIAFTCTVEEASATYTWTRIDVQPAPEALPDQTGQSGKFLTTDGTDASWAAVNTLQNTATGTDALTILGTAATNNLAVNIGVLSEAGNSATAVGRYARATYGSACAYGNSSYAGATFATAVGDAAFISGSYGVALGAKAQVAAQNAIQIGSTGTSTSNSDANTFKVANANGNFEIMNANGNLPADRLASTTGLADGNYRLRLTMASGVPTLSWVAE